MAESMIERVARALAPKAWVGSSLSHKNRRTASLRHARSAIEAMGDPTTKMLAAASDLMLHDQDISEITPMQMWSAMISSALTEPKEGGPA